MPKKVDWVPIEADYMSGMSVPDLIAKYGVSDRSIERHMSDGNWADLRKAQKVVSFAKPEAKPEKVKTEKPVELERPAPAPAIARNGPRVQVGGIDTEEMLSHAIQKLSGDVSGNEAQSADKAAMAMAKLIETYRKYHPQTMSEAVDWLLGLPDFDPQVFAKLLKERWLDRRAG